MTTVREMRVNRFTTMNVMSRWLYNK